METIKADGAFRPLLEVERRVMRRALSIRRHRLSRLRRRFFLSSSAVFGTLWGLTMAVSRDRAVVITAVWLAVGTVLGLWSYFGARRDLSTDVNRFEQALRRNQVRELRVQSA